MKTIQDYLREMQEAGHRLPDIIKVIDSHLGNTRDSLAGTTAQYLGAARNNTQIAFQYLERYEAETGTRIPLVSVQSENG